MRAVVLRDGRLHVRETAEPVPGPGELLIKPLSAAICASDVHYMDHRIRRHGSCGTPTATPSWATSSSARWWVTGRTARVTSRSARAAPRCRTCAGGAAPRVIGHHPDAPGGFGELMVVSEMMARKVEDGVSLDAAALVDAFAVGEFYVRCSGVVPASCRS